MKISKQDGKRKVFIMDDDSEVAFADYKKPKVEKKKSHAVSEEPTKNGFCPGGKKDKKKDD
jgi:hypothetical protein